MYRRGHTKLKCWVTIRLALVSLTMMMLLIVDLLINHDCLPLYQHQSLLLLTQAKLVSSKKTVGIKSRLSRRELSLESMDDINQSINPSRRHKKNRQKNRPISLKNLLNVQCTYVFE
jgi:hypothetical protein